MRRLDAEHDDTSRIGGRDARLDGFPELRFGRYLMVGRDHEHKRVGAMFGDRLQGGYGDRGGGIAADRLEDRSAAVKAERSNVRDDAVGMPFGRYQVDRRL